MRPGIHIVDDDPDIRDGLAWLFDSRGYEPTTWDGGQVFLDAVRQRPLPWGQAVVLLDVRMAPISGLVTFEQLKALACPWPVLFLTGNGDVSMAVAAVKSGAWDFLEKPFHDNELVDRVDAALRSDAKRHHIDSTKNEVARRKQNLTARESQVMERFLAGKLNKNIAEELDISMRTVEVHRAKVFEKMGVKTAVELAGLLQEKP
jgi:two-component system response regulator DctR